MNAQQIEVAQRVASFFGLAPFSDEQSSWQVRYSLPDGGSLNFCDDDRGKRLKISAWVANDLQHHAPGYYNQVRPITSITVSLDKSLEKICREIKSRLIPGYKQHAANCAANKEKADKETAEELELLNAVAEPFGQKAQTEDSNRWSVKPLRIRRVGLWMEAKHCYDGTVKLEITDLTKENAAKLAELLSNLCPPVPVEQPAAA